MTNSGLWSVQVLFVFCRLNFAWHWRPTINSVRLLASRLSSWIHAARSRFERLDARTLLGGEHGFSVTWRRRRASARDARSKSRARTARLSKEAISGLVTGQQRPSVEGRVPKRCPRTACGVFGAGSTGAPRRSPRVRRTVHARCDSRSSADVEAGRKKRSKDPPLHWAEDHPSSASAASPWPLMRSTTSHHCRLTVAGTSLRDASSDRGQIGRCRRRCWRRRIASSADSVTVARPRASGTIVSSRSGNQRAARSAARRTGIDAESSRTARIAAANAGAVLPGHRLSA